MTTNSPKMCVFTWG